MDSPARYLFARSLRAVKKKKVYIYMYIFEATNSIRRSFVRRIKKIIFQVFKLFSSFDRERRKKKEDVWKFRRERGKLEFEKEGGDKLANFLFVLSGGERRGETGRGDERILQKDKKK